MDSELDCKREFEEDLEDIDTFIKRNYSENVERKRKSSPKKRRSPRKSRSRKSKTRNTGISNEEDKKSTEAEIDDKDIHSLLPLSPKLKDSDGNK